MSREKLSRENLSRENLSRKNSRVIFIQHDGTAEEGLIPNTPGWDILKPLTKDKNDIVIRKTTNDAFYETELHKTLGLLDAENIIIAGWATDFCVDTTIRSAVNHKYNVIVAADCHTVSDRPHLSAEKVIEHHNWIWKNLISPVKNVIVMTVEDLCDR